MRPALQAVLHAARKFTRVLTDRLVTFGDSTVEGTTSSSNRWAQLRATELGIPLINQGVSGTVMQNRADSSGSPRASNGRGRYVAALLGSNLSSRYEILYGLNDLRYTAAPATMNLANFITDYSEVVDGLIAAGVQPANITLGSPIWIPDVGYATGSTGFTGSTRVVHEQYIAAIYNLAFTKGAKYAAAYERIRDNGGASLIAAAPDNIHPTNQGMVEIATAFSQAVVPVSGIWTGGAAPDTTAPTASSALVNNSAPSVVRVTMNEPMNTSFTPPAAAFTMGAHTATDTAYADSTHIDVAVAEPFTFGETARTISYTATGTNNARDVAGNLLANFTGLAITNNVSEAVPPGTPVDATFSQTNSPTWRTVSAQRYDAGAGSATAFDGIAQLTGSTTVGTAARVSQQFVSSASPDGSGGLIVLDPASGLTAFTSNANRKFLCQLISTGAVLYSENSSPGSLTTLSGGAFTFSSASANNWVSLYLAPSGTVTIETSTDNQATWTVRHTFTDTATGSMFWRLYVTQHRDMFKPMQYGVA
jgi:lysophospholipase L1-like esterase